MTPTPDPAPTPKINDRVKLPGEHRLYTVRAVAGDILTIVGSAAGSVRVVRADEVTVVRRRRRTKGSPGDTPADQQARDA